MAGSITRHSAICPKEIEKKQIRKGFASSSSPLAARQLQSEIETKVNEDDITTVGEIIYYRGTPIKFPLYRIWAQLGVLNLKVVTVLDGLHTRANKRVIKDPERAQHDYKNKDVLGYVGWVGLDEGWGHWHDTRILTCSWNGIKDELAWLDPLLRNVGEWSVPVGNGDETCESWWRWSMAYV
ncbi:hypothetical protein BGW80DRAFT_1254029 [Lactifluus volemus]|nr:hypothetical protein BGW80DRAFT_1254029 [Lactifluus volemus]